MVAPLAGAAAVAAARLIAAQLLKQGAKTVVKQSAKKSVKTALKTAKKTKPLATPKSGVKVKPPAKTKPKSPNTSQMEYRFGMSNNRMINKGVPVEARSAGGKNRRDAIAESKLTGKPVRNTKPKLVMEKAKPPKKTIGNPPNLARAKSRQIESVARAGGVKGPLGKRRDSRVFTSKKPTKKQIDEHYRSLFKQWND
jgi:hypothetical protein